MQSELARLTLENGPIVIDKYGEELAWRPLDHGTWTPLRAQQPAASGEVERVARIISPSFWRVMDAEKAQMLRKYKGQNIGYDPEQFQHRESMAKAREILATLPTYAQGRKDGIEEAAKVAEKRAEKRFAEYGVREWDTNATYYEGEAAELYESLDEENEAIAAAIRALGEPGK